MRYSDHPSVKESFNCRTIKFFFISIYIRKVCEMSESKGTKTTKGGSSTEVLVLYIRSETYRLSHYFLREEMSEHEGIDDSGEMTSYPDGFESSVCRDRFSFLVVVHREKQ